MTRIDQIIEDIIVREGGFNDRPEDKGGPTCWGISKRYHPDAWLDGPPTKDVARAIYETRYVKPFEGLDAHILEQVVDLGVNSGVFLATKMLQRAAGVKEDGVLGPKTLGVVNSDPSPKDLNNKLVAERLRMFGRIVQRDKSQAVFIAGWINRALEFLWVGGM